MADQGEFAALIDVGDGSACHAPSVPPLLDGTVVESRVGAEPFVEPAMAVACELNAELKRPRGVILPDAAVAS